MESPYIHVLKEVGWQLFGTLTFKQERLPERVRFSMAFALLRKAARDHKVKFPKLLWCLRQEHGEATGRLHFHFLLAGLPPEALTMRTRFAIKNAWESNFKGGMARVDEFDPTLNAGRYLTKGGSDPGDVYESAKFGSVNTSLTISESVWRYARAKRRRQLMD